MTPTTECLKQMLINVAEETEDGCKDNEWEMILAMKWLIQAELSRREEVKPAKCVCELGDTTCGRPFVQHPEHRVEYCGNRVDNVTLCGHDRACHGGEK